nr:MAG TPA_asm: hypothetical protein [Caudoviricetes sp.]
MVDLLSRNLPFNYIDLLGHTEEVKMIRFPLKHLNFR